MTLGKRYHELSLGDGEDARGAPRRAEGPRQGAEVLLVGRDEVSRSIGVRDEGGAEGGARPAPLVRVEGGLHGDGLGGLAKGRQRRDPAGVGNGGGEGGARRAEGVG